MADKISKAARSENMRRIKSTGMKPELFVRRLTHSLGYRYRLHGKDLPGKPDLVFRPHKKVIFIHGCFWHQHSSSKCCIVRKPKSNRGYWNSKLDNNVKRDRRNRNKLHQLGWQTLTIWECEIQKPAQLQKKIIHFLGDR